MTTRHFLNKKFLNFLIISCVIISSNLVLNVACDKNNNDTQRNRERLLHSYHNIVIRNTANSSTNGILPYLGLYRTIYHVEGDELIPVDDCVPPSAISDFPGTIFPEDMLLKGAVIFHIVAAIYFLSVLAIVCGHYFIPSVECICEDLHLSTDVAAATFMATATTMPEFFTNTISTFVTDSDLGIGAIIGSMLFNTLGTAACAALAANKPIPIDWWPLSRDSLLFSINVSLLVAFAFDGVIWWYESMTFVILYILYFCIMFQNVRISKYVRPFLERNLFCFKKKKVYDLDNGTKDVENGNIPNGKHHVANGTNGYVNNSYVTTEEKLENTTPESTDVPFHGHMPIIAPHIIEDEIDEPMSLWKLPEDSSVLMKIWWFYTWPIRIICTCLIPNPKTYRKLYPLTFIMCMFVLAVNSYMVVWMVTVIGYTFAIPEAVMGLTFLAAGGCLPEAFSAIIMARKGDGALGISNSLGSSSLNILFSLGFPWFLRSMVDFASGVTPLVNIYNNGMEFTIMILLLAILSLYLIISCSGYRLTRTIGGSLLCVYIIFVTIASLIQLLIFITPHSVCPI
ncbi:sodium/potassium/calcium exchanger 4-like isoform X2 [Culicoides brevitarsis]|uniref:sodium/potassium/calcium exchanger 4-like isoform X2 n=1 Tax=Culicoides brevitarsis TaxID=469753 RepID=UPI00307C0965